MRERAPVVAQLALENKKFLTRTVHCVASRGIRQSPDVGSGLPASPVREPGAEPLWLATPIAGRGRGIAAVQAGMRDPRAILACADVRAAGFSPAGPACVILARVLHFVDHQTAADAADAAAGFAGSLAPGSYLIISAGYDEKIVPDKDFAEAYNAQQGPRTYRQSRAGFNALFEGHGGAAAGNR